MYYAATEMEARQCSASPVGGGWRGQLGRSGGGVPGRGGQSRHHRHPRAEPGGEHVAVLGRPDRRRPPHRGTNEHQNHQRSTVSEIPHRRRESPGADGEATWCPAPRCSPSSVPTPPRSGCRGARRSTTVGSCVPIDPLADQHLDGRWEAFGPPTAAVRDQLTPACSPSAISGRVRPSGSPRPSAKDRPRSARSTSTWPSIVTPELQTPQP